MYVTLILFEATHWTNLVLTVLNRSLGGVRCRHLDGVDASKDEKTLSRRDARKAVAPSAAQVITSPTTLSCREQDGHESPRPSTGRLDFPQPERISDKPRMEVFQDTKIHVGGGNIMSYRWVTRATARPAHNGSVLEATVALSTSREAMGLAVDRKEDFLLIILPDLLMTMDSMESRLGGILELNPQGRLLLVSHYVVAPVGASFIPMYQNGKWTMFTS